MTQVRNVGHKKQEIVGSLRQSTQASMNFRIQGDATKGSSTRCTRGVGCNTDHDVPTVQVLSVTFVLYAPLPSLELQRSREQLAHVRRVGYQCKNYHTVVPVESTNNYAIRSMVPGTRYKHTGYSMYMLYITQCRTSMIQLQSSGS